MNLGGGKSVLLIGALCAGTANEAGACSPGPVPASWAAQTAPTPYTPTAQANAITLIMFRHGEKTILPDGGFLENGNMNAVGQKRAQRLPARLKQMFGCPDYLVAPDPGVKIEGDNGDFYYYERPAGTIEPTAAGLAYPLWMPYGFYYPEYLAADLLTAPEFAPSSPSQPNKVFIAWEHNNIVAMTNYIVSQWNLNVLPAGKKVSVNGKTYRCQSIPSSWSGCDYDSVWVLNIQEGNLCYTHMQEHLNNPAYQKACLKAD
ncbi:MAG: hypothetical protein AB1648_13310 [Pseudomonadota bacterium]|jgi:hypothetical protein